MKRFKVLYMTNVPAPYRVDFFNLLGLEVELTVTFDEPNKGHEYDIRNQKWFNSNFKNFNAVFLNNNKIKFNTSVIKLIKKIKFDFIIVGEYSSITSIITMKYMKRHNIKFILNSDGGFPKKAESILKRTIKHNLISSATYYITSGKNGAEFLEYYGAERKKIFYYTFSSFLKKEIPESIISETEKMNIKLKLNIVEKNVILLVSQIIWGKGIDVLINSDYNFSDDVGFYVIGGNINSEYDKLLKLKNINNFHFLGYKNKDELKEYLKVTDIFAFPTRSDVWGFALTEAMSYGIPSISTNMCGAGLDMIKNNINGFIINNEDYNALHDKIDFLLNNNIQRKKMAYEVLNDMKSFSIENEVKDHLKIFERISKDGE